MRYGELFICALLQQVRGASALAAGLLLDPQGIGALLPRTLAGRLTDRIGPQPVVLAGMAIAAAGTISFALAWAHTSELLLSGVLVVRGAGLTTANIALRAGAFTGLPRESVPDASSVTRIMQQVGGSFGTAVLALILVGHSFQATFWWSVAFTALAVLPAAMLPAAGSGPGPEPRARDRLPARRRHRDRPAGLGPDGPARVSLAVTPAAGAGGDHGEAPAALGHQVEPPGRRNGRAAVVGDGDAGYPVPRAVDLDREHAAAPRGGVRDRIGTELGHAGHQRLAGRASG